MWHTFKSSVEALILLALCAIFPLQALALRPDQIVVLNKDAVATVETESSQGSGVVTNRGTVLTNCHVVAGARSMKVRVAGKSFEAQLVAGNVASDLCRLQVSGLTAKPVVVRDIASVRLGERVVAIGSPLGLETSVSDGLVSGFRDVGDSLLIQTSAPISPGSSGGGLFDEEGRLLGITSATRKGAQNINFAIPAALQSRMSPLNFIERFDETRLLSAEMVNKLMDLYERHRFMELDEFVKPWLEAEGNSAYALSMAGFARMLVDKPAEAKALFQKALKGNEEFTPALYGLAMVDATFNPTSAKVDQVLLDRCIATGTTANSIVAVFRAQCLAAKKDPAGVAILDAFITDQPNRSWIHLFRSRILATLGRFDEALKEASVARVLKPESTDAVCSATMSLLGLRRFDKAAESARVALTLSPNSSLALQMGVLAAISVQDIPTAKQRFDAMTKVAPLMAAALRSRFASGGPLR